MNCPNLAGFYALCLNGRVSAFIGNELVDDLVK